MHLLLAIQNRDINSLKKYTSLNPYRSSTYDLSKHDVPLGKQCYMLNHENIEFFVNFLQPYDEITRGMMYRLMFKWLLRVDTDACLKTWLHSIHDPLFWMEFYRSHLKHYYNDYVDLNTSDKLCALHWYATIFEMKKTYPLWEKHYPFNFLIQCEESVYQEHMIYLLLSTLNKKHYNDALMHSMGEDDDDYNNNDDYNSSCSAYSSCDDDEELNYEELNYDECDKETACKITLVEYYLTWLQMSSYQRSLDYTIEDIEQPEHRCLAEMLTSIPLKDHAVDTWIQCWYSDDHVNNQECDLIL